MLATRKKWLGFFKRRCYDIRATTATTATTAIATTTFKEGKKLCFVFLSKVEKVK